LYDVLGSEIKERHWRALLTCLEVSTSKLCIF